MDSYAIKIDISIKPEHIGGRVVPKIVYISGIIQLIEDTGR